MTPREILARTMVARMQPMKKSGYEGIMRVTRVLHNTLIDVSQLHTQMGNREANSLIREDEINVSFGGYSSHFFEVFTYISHIFQVRLYCKLILAPGYDEPESIIRIIGNKDSVMIVRRLGIWLNECEMSIAENIIKAKKNLICHTTHEDRWALKVSFYKTVFKVIDQFPITKNNPKKLFNKRPYQLYRANLLGHLAGHYPNAKRIAARWRFKDGHFLMIYKRKSNVTK